MAMTSEHGAVATTRAVIASHRASKDARPSGRAMAKQSRGTSGRRRLLDRHVASLLAMTQRYLSWENSGATHGQILVTKRPRHNRNRRRRRRGHAQSA